MGGFVLNEVAGTGGDPSLSTSLAAVDSCHQETVLLEEVLGQLEGQMAQLGAAIVRPSLQMMWCSLSLCCCVYI